MPDTVLINPPQSMSEPIIKKITSLRPVPNLIFASRRLQLPLYLGLILAQVVFVFHFWVELVHLLEVVFGSQPALQALITNIDYKPDAQITSLDETIIVLMALALIAIVMISNLLIMVIVGGYQTFVGRMTLHGHSDQPEWLTHVNASALKVKLATAIIGISSIHPLKTFINAANDNLKAPTWQTIIYTDFRFGALAIALTDRLMSHSQQPVR